MSTFSVAVLSIALSVCAQFLLKIGVSSSPMRDLLQQPLALRSAFDIFADKFVLAGFVLYGLGAVIWMKVLSQWDVSKAYPLVGLGFALTAGIGLMAGETVTTLRIVGIAFICGGVFLVANS